MYTNYPCGLALAHNGNLTNADVLREAVQTDFRHINTESDSEILLNVLAEELRSALDLSDHKRHRCHSKHEEAAHNID